MAEQMHEIGWIMPNFVYRALALAGLVAALAVPGAAATLEKLSLEQMTAKSTLIVRGRVTGCAGEQRGSIIYTKCAMTVTERWKGQSASRVDFYIPGGTAQGLRLVITGAPNFSKGDEYVMFLWAGRSGILHVIGLSQGAFDVTVNSKGVAQAHRSAASTVIVDKSGNSVQDADVEMGVAELRQRVNQALQSGASQ